MVTEDIRKELFRLQDKKYRDFQSKLIPTVEQDSVIGVRTPELRKFAKQIANFLNSGVLTPITESCSTVGISFMVL